VRSAEQIGKTPEEWADYQRAHRLRILAALLRELKHARETRAAWYVWVTEVYAHSYRWDSGSRSWRLSASVKPDENR